MIRIAPAPKTQQISQQAVDAFEDMLPTIQRVAHYAFRRAPRWRREELIADVVAKSFEAYVQLVLRGRASLAFPSVLAHFAVKQVCGGRGVGVRQNVRDVMSSYAQQRKGFSVVPLVRRNGEGEWEEVLVEDRRSSPADLAAFRLDFRDWLRKLRRVQRQLALWLASGDTPSELAERLQLSRARITQLRHELQSDWEQFQAMPAA